MKIIKFMLDDKKPLAASGDRKPSLQQPGCITWKECFEQEEHTLNYVLNQVMFYKIFGH